MSIRAAVIPDSVWEKHKSAIQAFYAEEKLELVANHMREQFDFDATEKQYKRRLAKWAIAKNIKNQEVQKLLEDPAAPRTIRGQQVSEIKIKRHYRRKMKRQQDSQSPPPFQLTDMGDRDRSAMKDPQMSASATQTAVMLEPQNLVIDQKTLDRRSTALSIGVHALLLLKILELKRSHFQSTLSEPMLVEDIIAVKLRNRRSLYVTFQGLRQLSSGSDGVFKAAFFLWRRRALFLSNGSGSSGAENVPAAVMVAEGGWPKIEFFKQWSTHLSKANLPWNRLLSFFLIEYESVHKEALDDETWKRWRRLMQKICRELAKRNACHHSTPTLEQELATEEVLKFKTFIPEYLSSQHYEQ